MARINRTSILVNQADLALIQQGDIATELNKVVVPVLEIGAKTSSTCKAASGATTSDVNLYTTPRDKDFYLTYVHLRGVKDATHDGTSATLQVVMGGATTALVRRYFLSATAETFEVSVVLPYPLKIDRNSVISITATFSAGTMTKSGCIAGFILE